MGFFKMLNNSPVHPILPHLAVCITFFYVPNRLPYLSKIIANYIGLANKTDIYIVTNITDTKLISETIPSYDDQLSIEFIVPSNIGHPYLLTWVHREIFQKIFTSSSVSHFLYTEDDQLFGRSNVMYWLKYREPLQKHGLIPSFFRVEKHPEKGWVATDISSRQCISCLPHLKLEDGSLFTCMPNPYQGLYFLDRPLMEEFAKSPAISPDFGRWDIREKATQGLTFVNIPKGYTSRNVTPVDSHMKTVPQEAWIHHLPNNYANNPNSIAGKISMQNPGLFVPSFNEWLEHYLNKIKRIIRNK